MKRNGGQQGTTRRPEEILAEIEHTRQEMDSTLTAIEHRLTPGQLLDQGLDYLRGSGANEFVQNLGAQVKYNPMPVALVGIGLGWLMASSRRPPQYGSYSEAGTSGPGLAARAGEMKDRMSERMSQASDRISQASERMTSLGQSARERVSGMSESARHQVARAKSGFDYMLREQPLALGAIGLAIGAVVAAMAPRTRQEDELMGESRDRLMEQAKQTGKDKLEQAKEVANAAMGTATKEAEQRGLKPQPERAIPQTEQSKPKADPFAKPSVTPATGTGTPGGPGKRP